MTQEEKIEKAVLLKKEFSICILSYVQGLMQKQPKKKMKQYAMDSSAKEKELIELGIPPDMIAKIARMTDEDFRNYAKSVLY